MMECLPAKDTRAVSIVVHFIATEYLTAKEENKPREWKSLPEQFRARGRFWVIKSDGTVSSHNVERLKEALGWDGDFSTLRGQACRIPCRFTTKHEKGQDGNDYFPVAFVDPFEMKPMGSDYAAKQTDLDHLNQMYGSQTRAIAGATEYVAAETSPTEPPVKSAEEVVAETAKPASDPKPSSSHQSEPGGSDFETLPF
jgi:hypothetical protein